MTPLSGSRVNRALLALLLSMPVGAVTRSATAQTSPSDGPSVTITLVDWEQRDDVSLALRVWDEAQGLGGSVGESTVEPGDPFLEFPGPEPRLLVDRPGTYGVYVGQNTNTGAGVGTAYATVAFRYQADPSTPPAAVTRTGQVGLDPDLVGAGHEYAVGFLLFQPDEGIVLLVDAAGLSVDLETGDAVSTPEGVSIPGMAVGAPLTTAAAEDPRKQEAPDPGDQGATSGGGHEPDSRDPTGIATRPAASTPGTADEGVAGFVLLLLIALGFVAALFGLYHVLRHWGIGGRVDAPPQEAAPAVPFTPTAAMTGDPAPAVSISTTVAPAAMEIAELIPASGSGHIPATTEDGTREAFLLPGSRVAVLDVQGTRALVSTAPDASPPFDPPWSLPGPDAAKPNPYWSPPERYWVNRRHL